MPWLVLLPHAWGSTLEVSTSGAPYTSVQEAIDAATDGDTVLVGPGTWWECLDLEGKDLTVASVEGSGATRLDASGLCEDAISILSGEGASVQGFTVQNDGGRGVHIDGGSVGLEDVVIIGSNDPTSPFLLGGSALWLESGDLSWTSGRVMRAQTPAIAAVVLGTGTTSVLAGLDISGNKTPVIIVGDSAELTLSGTTFADNPTLPGGASLEVWEHGVVVSDGNVWSDPGRAIHLIHHGSLTSSGDTFLGNLRGSIFGEYSVVSVNDDAFIGSAAGTGGAIFVYAGQAYVTDSLFDQNAGNVIYLWERARVSITGSVFTNNGGRAITVEGAASVSNSWFCGNAGGALYAATFPGQRASVYNSVFVENGGTVVDIRHQEAWAYNNTFVGNTGSAVSMDAGGNVVNNIFAWNSGGVAVQTYYAVFNNDFFGNTAGDISSWSPSTTTTHGNITSEPGLTNYSMDGVCGNDALTLRPVSRLINAGYRGLNDVDGSRSDIGAFGGSGSTFVDLDGDGFVFPFDCDDTQATLSPLETETCNGIDDNCDGEVDEGTGAAVWYDDADGDGLGDATTGALGCTQPSGTVANGDDCDDADPTSGAVSAEVPYDGIDQDCDGSDLTDVDGDGADAWEVGGTDCDDTLARTHPGVPEIWYDGIDEDCSGTSDFDQDGDGFDTLGPIIGRRGNRDCNDRDAAISPAASDPDGDGIDQDCSGADGEAPPR